MKIKQNNTGITWSMVELEGLLEDENSCVYLEKCRKHLGLHPFHLTNLQLALNEILSSGLNVYDSELKGFLIAYKNPKVLTPLGEVFYDTCFIHVDIEADFYVFRPQVNHSLKGTVNKKGIDHLGLLVHKAFNVTIPKSENFEDWPNLNIGQEVQFTVMHLDFHAKLPVIRGALDSRTYLQGCRLSGVINGTQHEETSLENEGSEETKVNVKEKKKKRKKQDEEIQEEWEDETKKKKGHKRESFEVSSESTDTVSKKKKRSRKRERSDSIKFMECDNNWNEEGSSQELNKDTRNFLSSLEEVIETKIKPKRSPKKPRKSESEIVKTDPVKLERSLELNSDAELEEELMEKAFVSTKKKKKRKDIGDIVKYEEIDDLKTSKEVIVLEENTKNTNKEKVSVLESDSECMVMPGIKSEAISRETVLKKEESRLSNEFINVENVKRPEERRKRSKVLPADEILVSDGTVELSEENEEKPKKPKRSKKHMSNSPEESQKNTYMCFSQKINESMENSFRIKNEYNNHAERVKRECEDLNEVLGIDRSMSDLETWKLNDSPYKRSRKLQRKVEEETPTKRLKRQKLCDLVEESGEVQCSQDRSSQSKCKTRLKTEDEYSMNNSTSIKLPEVLIKLEDGS